MFQCAPNRVRDYYFQEEAVFSARQYKLIIPTVLKSFEIRVRLTRDSFLKVVAANVAPLRLLDQCALNAGIFFNNVVKRLPILRERKSKKTRLR